MHSQWITKSLAILLVSFCNIVYADEQTLIIQDKTEVTLHADGTNTTLTTLTQQLNSPAAAQAGQKSTLEYFPNSSSLNLVNAYLINPNGQKTDLTNSKIYLAPSAASADAPGYTNSVSKTFIFPQITPGSTTSVTWQMETKQINPFGYSIIVQPNFSLATRQKIFILHYPANMPIYWSATDKNNVSMSQEGNTKTLTVTFNNTPAQPPENAMVNASDLLPYVQISTIKNWSDFGNIWWKFYAKQIIVSPEIQQAAQEIVGNSTELDAVAKIYNWVTAHIQYIEISSNAAASYIPSTPQQVFDNGYGDCKDYAILVIGLCKAIGIDVQPAMIGWDNSFRKYPLPSVDVINHAIIYLPKYKLFLNPTNIYGTFGSLDTYLLGKPVLMLGENSFQTLTPTGNPRTEIATLTRHIGLSANGTIVANLELSNTGSLGTLLRSGYFQYGLMGFFQQLLSNTPNVINIGNNTAQNMQQLVSPAVLSSTATMPEFVAMNKTIFLSSDLHDGLFEHLYLRNFITQGQRLYPLVIGAKTLIQHDILTIPNGYKAMVLPQNFSLTNKAGSYSATYQIKQNQVLSDFKLVINQDIYSAAESDDLNQLLYRASNMPKQVIMLQRQ